MRFIKPLLIAIFLKPFDLLALPLVFIALAGAKWDAFPSLDSNGQGLTIRGDLPDWAWFLQTPDERLPGGTYEPTVASVLEKYGPLVCSLYWLGLRNRMHGLAAYFGVPVASPWSPIPGFYDNGVLWWLRYPIGRFQLKAGYRTYGIKGQWLAVPCLTITKA